MNGAIKQYLSDRAGRWVTLQVHGTVFVGKLVLLTEDGVVLEATSGRSVALDGKLIMMAIDPENEAELEAQAAKHRDEQARTTH